MLSVARYVFAWFLLVLLPPAVLYWFAIHPFAALWRRLGRGAGLAAGFGTLIASALVLGGFAPRLLVTQYGFSWALTAVALVLEVAAGMIQRARRKHLTFRILLGAPELATDPAQSRLLQEGIYARIRHPRYVEVALAATGYALFANYLAAYVATAASILGIGLVVVFEERELASRFGPAWEAYAARTPRFIPRLRA